MNRKQRKAIARAATKGKRFANGAEKARVRKAIASGLKGTEQAPESPRGGTGLLVPTAPQRTRQTESGLYVAGE